MDLQDMNDVDRVEKRKKKFSNYTNAKILSDPLRDRALLSRTDSIHENIQHLQSNQEARSDFLRQIITLYERDPENDEVGHGLRKLREVTISVFRVKKSDMKFIEFAFKLSLVSVKYHLNRGEILKTLSSLQFVVDTPKLRSCGPHYQELVGCYALYASHVDRNVEKCIRLVSEYLQNSSYQDTCLRLTLIYCVKSEPSSNWFSIVSQLPEDSLMRQFLAALPAFESIKQETIAMISKCYHQLNLNFLQVCWFHGMVQDLEETLARKWTIDITSTNEKIVKFKQRKP